MLSESEDNSMIGYFIKSYWGTDRYRLNCNLFLKNSHISQERRMLGLV